MLSVKQCSINILDLKSILLIILILDSIKCLIFQNAMRSVNDSIII